MSRLKKNRLARLGLYVVCIMTILGYSAPLIAKYVLHFSYDEQHTLFKLGSPGTRDVSIDHPTFDGDKTSFGLIDVDDSGFIECHMDGDVETVCPELDRLSQDTGAMRFFLLMFHHYDVSPGAQDPGKTAYKQPDGLISRAEFPADDTDRNVRKYAKFGLVVRGLFDKLDGDQDGFVDRAEVISATRYMRHDRRYLLEHYDDDNDLKISRDEYPGAPELHTFWLGVDPEGRDLLVRLLYGARISITIGIFATLVSLIIGVIWGAVAGYVGGRTDLIMMAIVDILYGVPFLFLVILLIVIAGRSTFNLFLALGMVQWLTMSRVVRGQVLSVKAREFVEAARAVGTPVRGILFRHILPNTIGPVIVYSTLMIPAVIVEEAFLSFLGLGVQPPHPSWGGLVSEGVKNMSTHPWLIIFPTLALGITLFSFNFLGDGVRDALDPQANVPK
jgi:oligopeptide transport system permease protein